MNKYGLSYDYPEYNAHITLSYDVTGFDISKLNKNDLPSELNIISEYKEYLDTNRK